MQEVTGGAHHLSALSALSALIAPLAEAVRLTPLGLPRCSRTSGPRYAVARRDGCSLPSRGFRRNRRATFAVVFAKHWGDFWGYPGFAQKSRFQPDLLGKWAFCLKSAFWHFRRWCIFLALNTILVVGVTGRLIGISSPKNIWSQFNPIDIHVHANHERLPEARWGAFLLYLKNESRLMMLCARDKLVVCTSNNNSVILIPNWITGGEPTAAGFGQWLRSYSYSRLARYGLFGEQNLSHGGVATKCTEGTCAIALLLLNGESRLHEWRGMYGNSKEYRSNISRWRVADIRDGESDPNAGHSGVREMECFANRKIHFYPRSVSRLKLLLHNSSLRLSAISRLLSCVGTFIFGDHLRSGLSQRESGLGDRRSHHGQLTVHGIQLTAINSQSEDSYYSQHAIDNKRSYFEPSKFPAKFTGGCLLACGLILGILGNFSLGYSGLEWGWGRRLLFGSGLWLIAVLLTIHAAILLLSASAPPPSDSRPVAMPLLQRGSSRYFTAQNVGSIPNSYIDCTRTHRL
jgi:hypothetical protein